MDWADHIVVDAICIIEIDFAVVIDIDLEHLFEIAICPDQTEKSDQNGEDHEALVSQARLADVIVVLEYTHSAMC